MEPYYSLDVNQLKTYGRRAFAQFTDIYEIESDFAAKVESQFNEMIQQARGEHA
jgi:type III restriction enzyme